MKKIKKATLYRHSGCEGCTKPCKFNGEIATEKQEKSAKFGCNNSRQ